ncbi:phosphoenolpyruvate synthase [Sulfurovum sp. zt1-1]|uniref:Phosphoenolpyruvate synthase n=1 Tax=Sulfurovum zhangzhouensis TaxID=3019067 RepID=A0ABT7QXX9_9BACT|nr:phosphoenolpyruvate synthase [Sulfurovum zhangzhouensis]MDM5271688.1 phosphoenolpyruvate synthase [Sulfurovum zhangzhouensis]
MSEYIKWFNELGMDDVDLVGGKNASLGEMYRHLSAEGILIPNGFAVTAKAYEEILSFNNAWEELETELKNLDPEDVVSLQTCGRKCREIVYACQLPETIEREIKEGFEALKTEYGDEMSLAVRSSATAEDSPNASFAGQNETFLNIRTYAELIESYKKCLASNFTDRSIHYKFVHGFDYLKVYLSVVMMKMVRSDIGQSGVMFSIDTENGFEDVVFINASYGLGENIVQGTIEPDSFYVHKPTFEKGCKSVLKRRKGTKTLRMVFNESNAEELIRNEPTTSEEQHRFCITDDEVLQLAEYAIKVEKHYTKQAGIKRPMDMEWAKDGIDGRLYMVQARPETVHSKTQAHILETYRLKEKAKLLIEGQAVGKKIGSGQVHKMDDLRALEHFREGNVLVAKTTSPDWEPVMKIASAIITETGGRTCHAAIVSRELGIPAVVGAQNAFELLQEGDEVTVSCAEGERGKVYEGLLDFEVVKTDLRDLPKTKTEIMMNLGNPEMAFTLASLPVEGIGLARMEFIINSAIKAHPMALLYPERTDEKTKSELNRLTIDYEDNKTFFVKTLSEGVATIASSVYPKPCVVRMSDFKSNEYASLIGGVFFEPSEENPMIGFRGASRYSHPDYEEGFAMECAAMKRVREEMGFDNVILMIPFCRRVAEAKQVIETMEKYGLKRGENGLKVYMMCELPSNVISIDAFSEYFDGFSIGSNDLTQLTLGVDRDSDIVAFDYDERDSGVLKLIEMAIEGAKRNGRHSGICGQAPSDYPEIAESLVKMGIDSISLNPDSVMSTIQLVSQIEAKED